MTHWHVITIPEWGECAQGYCECDGSGPHAIMPPLPIDVRLTSAASGL